MPFRCPYCGTPFKDQMETIAHIEKCAVRVRPPKESEGFARVQELLNKAKQDLCERAQREAFGFVDTPKVPWVLTENDVKFLRSLRIGKD